VGPIDIDPELIAVVLVASRALVSIAGRSIDAAPIEVTLSQFRALVVLATRDVKRMSVLGEVMGISASSTTRLVERLERKDLVLRRPSPTSRRETEIGLTDAGANLVEVVMKERLREIRAVLAKVPAARRQAMQRAFHDFADAAGEPMVPPYGFDGVGPAFA
jgi:DNA-binding MarR family transcriptional regulator